MSRHQFRTSTAGGGVALALSLALLAGCGADDGPAAETAPAARRTPAPAVGAAPTGSASPQADPGLVRGPDFTVTMPGKPTKSKEKPKSGSSRLVYTVWTYESNAAGYSFSRVAYPSSQRPSLEQAMDAAARQTGGQVATSRSLQYRGKPAREAAVVGALPSDREATVFARYVLVGRVMYGMIFYSKQDGAKKAKQQFDAFVGSLTFTTSSP